MSHRLIHSPLTHISDDEKLLQQAAEKFAQDRIKPLVRRMDDDSAIDEAIIKELFANGFMAVEIPTEYDGVG